MDHLLADSARSWLHTCVSFHQSSESVMLRPFLYLLKLSWFFIILLIIFLSFLASCELEGIFYLLFETFFESVNYLVKM